LFGNPNGLSKLACLSFWASISILLCARHRTLKIIMIASIVFTIMVVAATASRQAIVALFLMILTIYWFVLRKISTSYARKLGWLIVIGGLLGCTLFYMSQTAAWHRMEFLLGTQESSKRATSIEARASFFATSLETIAENPLIGVGYNCVGLVIGGLALKSSHNSIAGVAADTGLVGWSFFFGAWLVLLIRLHKVGKLPLPRSDRVLVLSMWLAHAAWGLWSLTTVVVNYKPFWAVLGVSLSYLVWLERTYHAPVAGNIEPPMTSPPSYR
jgi:hypothetical protein